MTSRLVIPNIQYNFHDLYDETFRFIRRSLIFNFIVRHEDIIGHYKHTHTVEL